MSCLWSKSKLVNQGVPYHKEKKNLMSWEIIWATSHHRKVVHHRTLPWCPRLHRTYRRKWKRKSKMMRENLKWVGRLSWVRFRCGRRRLILKFLARWARYQQIKMSWVRQVKRAKARWANKLVKELQVLWQQRKISCLKGLAHQRDQVYKLMQHPQFVQLPLLESVLPKSKDNY